MINQIYVTLQANLKFSIIPNLLIILNQIIFYYNHANQDKFNHTNPGVLKLVGIATVSKYLQNLATLDIFSW